MIKVPLRNFNLQDIALFTLSHEIIMQFSDWLFLFMLLTWKVLWEKFALHNVTTNPPHGCASLSIFSPSACHERRLSGLTTFVLVMIRIFLLFGKILAEAEAEQRNWPVVKKKKEKSVQWSQSEAESNFPSSSSFHHEQKIYGLKRCEYANSLERLFTEVARESAVHEQI